MAGPELKAQEDRLRFLVSRIDSEVKKFQDMLSALERKQEGIQTMIKKQGLEPVPIRINPHSTSTQNLIAEMQGHVMELNKLKNYVNQKLNEVVREEGLREKLSREFGEKIQIKKLPSGEFEIDYSDPDTLNLFTQVQASKKTINQLREKLAEVEKEEALKPSEEE